MLVCMRMELRGTRPSMRSTSTRYKPSSLASLCQMNEMLGSLASYRGGQRKKVLLATQFLNILNVESKNHGFRLTNTQEIQAALIHVGS